MLTKDDIEAIKNARLPPLEPPDARKNLILAVRHCIMMLSLPVLPRYAVNYVMETLEQAADAASDKGDKNAGRHNNSR